MICGKITQLENVLQIASESYITQQVYIYIYNSSVKSMANIYRCDAQVIFQLYGNFRCLQVIYSR